MANNIERKVLNYFLVSVFLRVPSMESTDSYRIYGEISRGPQTVRKNYFFIFTNI